MSSLSAVSACRMCLAVDARVYSITNTPLQNVYERITDIPLLNIDRRPERVCYLCHHLLRKIHTFIQKSVKADELLRHALDRGIELTEATIRRMDTSEVCSSLRVSRPEHLNLIPKKPTDLNLEKDSKETFVKEEPVDDIEEMEVENSELLQRSMRALKADIDTMIQKTSGCIKDENVATAAPPSGDELTGLRTSDLPSECATSEANGETAARTGALNEASEYDFNEIKSYSKLDFERSSDAEHETPINHQNPYLGVDVSSNCTSKKILFCKQCGINFKTFRLLNDHTQIDHNSSLICDYCTKVFNNKRSLISHIKTHIVNTKPQIRISKASSRKIICTKSGIEFKSLIKTHEKMNQNMSLICDHCTKVFNNKRSLILHVKTHNAKMLYHNRENFNGRDLTNERKDEMSIKQYLCEYCDKGFSYKSLLINHLSGHSGDEPYKCNCCEQTFTRKQHLDAHMLIHAKGKNHRCSYCNKHFTKGELNRHILIHTGEKPHQCSYCNKAFSRKSHLTEHILIHTGKKLHQCSYCNKSFSQKCTLNQHILKHEGKKPHLCSFCNKTFTHRGHLNNHILIHTGEKPHQCSYCNKAFIQKSSLNIHILKHTGKKPHQCSYCNKAFAHKNTLKIHISNHTGDKPHQCSYCNKPFTLKSYLNQHILKHTGERPHKCSYCNKAFTRKSHLNQHILIHTKRNNASKQPLQ